MPETTGKPNIDTNNVIDKSSDGAPTDTETRHVLHEPSTDAAAASADEEILFNEEYDVIGPLTDLKPGQSS